MGKSILHQSRRVSKKIKRVREELRSVRRWLLVGGIAIGLTLIALAFTQGPRRVVVIDCNVTTETQGD